MICIIPARSGSVRTPGKNWAEVGGRSLVQRAVDCAIGAGLIPHIVTDDPERCMLPGVNGWAAYVHHEPAELAQPDVPMVEVLRWMVGECKLSTGMVVLLQPTSPLRLSSDVRACVKIMDRTGCDSVVSVVARNRELRRPFPHEPTIVHGYERNGAVYVTTVERVKAGEIIGGWTQFYVMPPERSVDVDTPEDLAEARRLAE